MSEKNLCSICGGLHPAGHRDKELEEKLEAVKTLYNEFPENFWVCGHSRKQQLDSWLDRLDKILEGEAKA